MPGLRNRYDLMGAARENISTHATGERSNVLIHGGLALFSLAVTAASIYGVVEAPTIADKWAAGAVGALFGIGAAFETGHVIANIAAGQE